jgi:hypothetical protein
MAASSPSLPPPTDKPRGPDRKNVVMFDLTLWVFTTAKCAAQDVSHAQTTKLPLAKQKAELAERDLPVGDAQRQKHVTNLANLDSALENSTRFLETTRAERESYIKSMPEYAMMTHSSTACKGTSSGCGFPS